MNKALLTWKYWTCLPVEIGTWAPVSLLEFPVMNKMNPQVSVTRNLTLHRTPMSYWWNLSYWGNLCRANAMFFSMVSLINEYIEVYDVSMKDKHTESHLQNTDLQSISPSNFRHNRARGGKEESNTDTIKMMTFKCLTSNLFFAVKTKQQVISFTVSHYSPVAP